jgi:putative ABC transport system ATP-binding protein
MELLVDAAREQGTSVLVVTHEARVAAYADRTVLVRDGIDAVPARADRP